MKHLNPEREEASLLAMAYQLCAAARTAPKGKGKDLLVTAVVGGSEKQRLADRMRQIAERDGVPFFARDAGNIEVSQLVVLCGSRKEPLGLPHCGYCGFKDCEALELAGGTCAFNSCDLGVAVGSAVSRAADLRLDSRIMYSAGKAAIELGIFPETVTMAYAIPLSVSAKSPFFDRG